MKVKSIKKTLAVMLSMAMMLSLAGCGDSSESQPVADEPAATAEPAADEAESLDEAAAEDTEAATGDTAGTGLSGSFSIFHFHEDEGAGTSKAKSQRLLEKNRERGRVRARYRKSIALGDGKKAGEIKENNLGLQKYDRQKRREQAKLETYVNAELNRMLETEKPGKIVITRPITVNKTKFKYKPSNRKAAESSRGYVRKRLAEKCQVNGIKLVEINSKGTGMLCSNCGVEGKCLAEGFVCESCGFKSTTALNGARNIEKKYREMNE